MRFHMLPSRWPEVIEQVRQIAADQGFELQHTERAEDADFLVLNGGAGDLPRPLPPGVGYVQYVFAGVERPAEAGAFTATAPGRWANAGGLFAKPVAEVALGLLIGLAHGVKMATVDGSFDRRWEIDARQFWLFHHKTVALVGAGGIARELIQMLRPFGARTIALNRSGREVPGAMETHPIGELDSVLSRADVVVLTAPLTPETRGMIAARELALMPDHALLVNVGRGALLDTDALVEALRNGRIAGCAMDVTEPEPLPPDHPLWGMDNVLITPHIAAPGSVARMLVAPQIVENAVAFARGERMPTEVNTEIGY